MKLLYVEDNDVDADLTRRALTTQLAETELSIVQGLGDARDALQRQPFDIVLCDLRLPDGSGLELLAWVREQALPLAVVMVTGSGDHQSAVAALKAGADDYLIKHGDYLQQLPNTLHHALARRRRQRTRETRPLQILYAEHSPFDIDLTRRYLADHAPHLRLDSVCDGHALLARLPKDPASPCAYDVVLLDYRLPGLDALDLAKILREERGLDLPLVLITGQGSEESAALALRMGVTEYVTKHPHYLPELVLVLEKSYYQVAGERERAALAATSAQLNHLLESSPTILYTLRFSAGQAHAVSVSSNITRLLGYPRDAVLARGWWRARIHPDDRDRVAAARHQLLEQDRLVRVYRFRDHNDKLHWIRDEQRLLRDGDGQPLEIAGAWNDITGQRLAEERLRLDDTIFAATHDGVLITDRLGTIERVNQAICEITGYSEAELLGSTPKLLRSKRHDTAFYGALWQQLLAAGRWDGEIWNRRKNGEVYPQRLSIRAILDEAGEPQHFISVATDLTQIHRSQSELEHLAHYDPLTDLPNRLLLQSRLDHALEQAQRQANNVSLMIVDLDRFKMINESLGHPAGDELLLLFGSRVRKSLRGEDTLARLSGDEFAILLQDVHGHHAAAEVASKVLQLLTTPFTLLGDREVFMHASIGISLYPTDGEESEELLRDAYAALHSLKIEGGGGYRFYTTSMNVDALRTMELEAALRRAESRGELVLYYQPKANLSSGHIAGAEALLRWRRGNTLVPPNDFIPIAERTGLIVSIGAWVIDEACRQIRAWQDAGLGEVKVAVNVSARQLRDDDLVRVVSEALRCHRVAPALLELELTESMLMEDPEAAVTMLQALHAIGLQITLDDFGTGYSSLAYLQRFPIDNLKIDRSFVEAMVQDPGAAAIATSIIVLARRLQLKVVAEGVETEAQLNFLRSQRCDLMQGFLFSRPLPADEFAISLQEGRMLRLPTPPARGRGLLIVDDEASIRSAVRRLLRGEGYTIYEAAGGSQALRQLAEYPIQVILTDQRMPGMSGTELMGHIKSLYPDSVRMLFSGYAELETVVEAVNQGALFKILFKPWDDEQLLQQIRDAFDYHEAVIKPRVAAADQSIESHTQ